MMSQAGHYGGENIMKVDSRRGMQEIIRMLSYPGKDATALCRTLIVTESRINVYHKAHICHEAKPVDLASSSWHAPLRFPSTRHRSRTSGCPSREAGDAALEVIEMRAELIWARRPLTNVVSFTNHLGDRE